MSVTCRPCFRIAAPRILGRQAGLAIRPIGPPSRAHEAFQVRRLRTQLSPLTGCTLFPGSSRHISVRHHMLCSRLTAHRHNLTRSTRPRFPKGPNFMWSVSIRVSVLFIFRSYTAFQGCASPVRVACCGDETYKLQIKKLDPSQIDKFKTGFLQDVNEENRFF